MLIPKLTGGPGQKFVKKDMTNSEVNDTKNQNNGPSSATTSTPASSTGDVNNTSSKSLVANYSDNSSPEDDHHSPGGSAGSPSDSNKGSSSPVGAGGALEMEVDEDGAPVQSTTPILKRPSPDSTSNSESNDSAAKKAKIDVEDNAPAAADAVDNNAALVTSSNDA